MFKLILAIVVAVAAANERKHEPHFYQLLDYKARTKNVPVLTTSAGAPIDYKTATSSLNDPTVSNEALMEMLMHFDREMIPSRNAHASGTGAFGYFEVSHDASKYCKADFLNGIGKKTPVVCRFSTTSPLSGASEFVRENRGFACKFYTREGNYDFTGLDSEVFSVNDPLHTANLVHAAKLNPTTNFNDPNMAWDLITQRPEIFRRLLHSMSPYGIPASYAHMSGHGVHTFELYNVNGTKYACKIDMEPCAGRKGMSQSDIERLSASEPNYFSKNLYNSIKKGNYPSWDMTLKCLDEEQVKKEGIDIYDITKLKAWNKYKAVKVGKMTLNKTYNNYFTDIEQLAFCPGNKVFGMLGSPDPLYQARTYSYKDTQLYRLGVNFERLKVNCPFNSKVNNYNRNGAGSNGDNGGEGPWYSFNTFNGPEPVKEKNRPSLSVIHLKEPNNLDDCQDFYYNMTAEDKEVVIFNFCNQLTSAYPHLRVKVIDYLYKINRHLGKSVETCLKKKSLEE